MDVNRAWLSAALLLLPGCAGSPNPGGVDAGAAGGAALVSDTQGAIDGLVLTTELFPILDAQVNLSRGKESLASTATDADGRFAFELREPGTYVVQAGAYLSRSRNLTVEVRPGEVTNARFLLEAVGAKEPYAVGLHRRGYQPCAAALILTPASFASLCDPANDRSANFFDIPEGYVAIVLETTWSNPSEEASNFFYCCNGTQPLSNGQRVKRILDYTWGPAPGKAILIPGVQNKKPAPPVGEQYGPTPNGTAFRLESKVFWAGSFAQYTQAFLPACSQLSYNRCSGVGFHPGFSFEMWFTVFVNGLRDGMDLAAYSALPDG